MSLWKSHCEAGIKRYTTDSCVPWACCFLLPRGASPAPPRPHPAPPMRACAQANRIYQHAMNSGVGPNMAPNKPLLDFARVNDAWIASMLGTGLQNLGVETVFRPRKSTSSFFLLKWGVQIQYLFNQKPNTPF